MTENSVRFISFDKFSPAARQEIILPPSGSVKLRKGYRIAADTLKKLTPTGLEVIGKQAGVQMVTQPYQTIII